MWCGVLKVSSCTKQVYFSNIDRKVQEVGLRLPNDKIANDRTRTWSSDGRVMRPAGGRVSFHRSIQENRKNDNNNKLQSLKMDKMSNKRSRLSFSAFILVHRIV